MDATLQQGDRLEQLALAQHGEAFAHRDKHLVEHGDAMFTSDAIGLVDASQQPVGLTPVVEDAAKRGYELRRSLTAYDRKFKHELRARLGISQLSKGFVGKPGGLEI